MYCWGCCDFEDRNFVLKSKLLDSHISCGNQRKSRNRGIPPFLHFARCEYSQAICLYLQKSAKSRIRDKNSIAHHTITTHITRRAHLTLREPTEAQPQIYAQIFQHNSFSRCPLQFVSFNMQSERQISSCVGVFLQSERQVFCIILPH